MRLATRRYRDDWIPNFFPAKQVADKIVRVSRHGSLVVLTQSEDEQLNEISMDDDLFERLELSGHILTEKNSTQVLKSNKLWLKGTFDGPGLHIVVPTRRCNLNCTYCHMLPQPMSADKTVADMQPETADKVSRFILSSPRKNLAIEFQGGEAFLNFPIIKQIVETVRRLNSDNKREVTFKLVSNLMVVSDEQLAYCKDNGIGISYSLNGPAQTHDAFRITRNGSGSHAIVSRRIDEIRSKYPGLLANYPLCVITNDNMSDLRELAKYYFDLGFRELGLIHLKNLGNARGNVKLTMREFIPHYIDLLEFLYDLNRTSDGSYTERYVKLAIGKIMGETNPLFVDWRNPIGYVTNCIVYDCDGTLLPVDEARSFKDVFALGNVLDITYEELIRDRKAFMTTNLSIRDRHSECRECSYNPYCGVSPVLNYAQTGSMIPRPHENDECLLVIALFDWVMTKLTQGDIIPLLKMVPGYVTKLSAHLRQDSEVCALSTPENA